MDIAKWVGAVPALLGFGLALGANPAIYAAVANLLARNKGIRVRLGLLVLGLYSGATILFFIFLAINPTKAVDHARTELDTALVNRIDDYIAAAVFFVLAIVFFAWLRLQPERPQPKKKQKKEKREDKTKIGKSHSETLGYFTVGLVGSTVGFTTLPIMYLVGRVVTGVGTELAPRIAAYVVFLVALAAPFVLMTWAWLHMPTLAGKITAGYARVLEMEYRGAVAALFLVAALIFLGLALFYPHAAH